LDATLIKAVCYTLSNLNNTDVDPMGHLRLFAPLEQAGVPIILGVENGKVFPDRVSDGDVVVIQRHFPNKFIEYKEIINRAHRENKPIIYDLDDLLFFLPEDHPDRIDQIYAPSLLPVFQAIIEADLVTVTTSTLRETISPFNENVVVLPNFFDDKLWHLREPSMPQSSDGTITIGYMGTRSHKPDLEMLLPVFLDIIHRYPQKIYFHIWGIEPPGELRSFSQVKWTGWYSYCYKSFAEFFQRQEADIFVAPLVDNLFNRCKSPLKFFEYSALGVPGVYSALEPYIGVVSHETNGYLANTLEEWRDFLVRLIENPNLRQQLAINAQKTIRQKWLLSQNAYQWKEAYQQLIKNNKQYDEPHPLFNLINSVNAQLFETIQSKDHAINSLKTQVDECDKELDSLKTQVGNLEREILHYVMSRSWRLTRPFRRLDRFVRKK